MSDPVTANPLPKTDAQAALTGVKGVINTLDTDAGKVKAWWKEYPFYAGLVVGAIVALVVRHFL